LWFWSWLWFWDVVEIAFVVCGYRELMNFCYGFWFWNVEEIRVCCCGCLLWNLVNNASLILTRETN
jgi:hypothetical protein